MIVRALRIARRRRRTRRAPRAVPPLLELMRVRLELARVREIVSTRVPQIAGYLDEAGEGNHAALGAAMALLEISRREVARGEFLRPEEVPS